MFTDFNLRESLINYERSRLRFKMFRFKALIADNSWLLTRFATKKLDILDAIYEFIVDQRLPGRVRVKKAHYAA